MFELVLLFGWEKSLILEKVFDNLSVLLISCGFKLYLRCIQALAPFGL